MNKLNRMVAVIAVGLFLPSINYAEYDYGSGPSSSFGSRATGIVRATGQQLNGATNPDSFSDQIQANLERVEQNLKDGQEEIDKRKRNAGGRGTIDKLKADLALPDLLTQGINSRREQQSKQLSQLFNSLNKTAPGVGSADINTNNLEPSCRSGVDFSQFKALADQLGSEPFRYLRDQGNQLLSEKDKELKAQKLQNLQKLAAQFEEAAERQEQDSVAEAASTKKSIINDENALKNRIAALDKTWKQQKSDITQLRKELVKKVFTSLIPQLQSLTEGDQKMYQVAAGFADAAENFRRAALDAAQQGVATLKKNCEKNVDMMGRDNPLAPGSLTNAAYQWVVAYHNGDADFYANRQFLGGMNQISQNLRCTDVSSDIDNLLGPQLQQQIASLRGQKDPRRLLQDSMGLLSNIGNAQSQVGQTLKPLMDDCQYAATNVKKVQQFIQGVQQQYGQQAGGSQQASGSQGGGRRRNSGLASRGGAGRANRGTTATH